MKPDPLASAREKILFYLKTRGPQTASKIAARLGVTPMAVRQHLYQLERQNLVSFEDRPAPVGRPARHWTLTSQSAALFPSNHSDLVLGLLDAVRSTFGEEGLGRLVQERLRRQITSYRKRIPGPGTPLEKRVATLASIRRDEGYMAEWTRESKGVYQIIENHCPICSAARSCPGLCNGELDLFRTLFGRDVLVDRTEHVLDGKRRCVYRVEEARK